MPNWCMTEVVFTGTAENLQRLYQDLKTVLAKHDDGWLGRLLEYHGVPQENIKCRGFITGFELKTLKDGTPYLHLETEDAWVPQVDAYNQYAQLYKLNYVYLAEEPGCEIYINTDLERKFFRKDYVFELFADSPEEPGDDLYSVFHVLSNIRYFIQEELEETIARLNCDDIKTITDLEKMAEKYPDYIGFYKFEAEY